MNLIEIFEELPQWTELYTTSHGKCYFEEMIDGMISCKLPNGTHIKLYNDGRLHPDGECVLFPSKELRDWKYYRAFLPKFYNEDGSYEIRIMPISQYNCL